MRINFRCEFKTHELRHRVMINHLELYSYERSGFRGLFFFVNFKDAKRKYNFISNVVIDKRNVKYS